MSLNELLSSIKNVLGHKTYTTCMSTNMTTPNIHKLAIMDVFNFPEKYQEKDIRIIQQWSRYIANGGYYV